jgi:hypothetical protein
LKDPYQFDFLTLRAAAHERDVERALVTRVKDLLLELGKGFSFIGSQHHLEVGGQDFYVDLLFYHRRLRCLVALDLKMGPIQPEHAGKAFKVIYLAQESPTRPPTCWNKWSPPCSPAPPPWNPPYPHPNRPQLSPKTPTRKMSGSQPPTAATPATTGSPAWPTAKPTPPTIVGCNAPSALHHPRGGPYDSVISTLPVTIPCSTNLYPCSRPNW